MKKQRVVEYIVKADEDFLQGFSTLGEARSFIRDLPVTLGIGNMPNVVQLIKTVTISEVINEYKPEQHIVLRATDAFGDIDLT